MDATLSPTSTKEIFTLIEEFLQFHTFSNTLEVRRPSHPIVRECFAALTRDQQREDVCGSSHSWM